MTELLVFSYGSNLCRERLRSRTPSARFVASAVLPGHALRLHKIGRDASGKADAFQTGREDDFLRGTVHAIPHREMPALDAAESRGRGYERHVVHVQSSAGTLDAVVYRAQEAWIDPERRPFDWYVGYMLLGASQHGLHADWIAELRRIEADVDPDAKRRRVHFETLQLAGYVHQAAR